MFRVRRRGANRSIPLLALAAIVLGGPLVPATAWGGSIEQTKREIAHLSAQLSEQQRVGEITSNQYDAAKTKWASINETIASLQHEEGQKRAAISVTAQALSVAVVRAYVLGASAAQILALFDQSVTTSDARRVYQDEVVGDLTTLRDRYESQKRSLDSMLTQNAHNEAVTRATLTVVTKTLRTQIIAYEIGAGVAAAKRHDVAGEEKAVAAASSVGGQVAATQVLSAIQAATPPLVRGVAAGSAQGMAALRAAISQIGVPYAWGGETPGRGFDCSGLVQWAWARAGFSIPRTTQSQYPALRHVPLGALQPGDLLFYYNLDGDHQVDHVVMYAGSGPWGTSTIISAAHSGTTVSYAPIFTFGLVGAGRP